jgi:hypothetical protein
MYRMLNSMNMKINSNEQCHEKNKTDSSDKKLEACYVQSSRWSTEFLRLLSL